METKVVPCQCDDIYSESVYINSRIIVYWFRLIMSIVLHYSKSNLHVIFLCLYKKRFTLKMKTILTQNKNFAY